MTALVQVCFARGVFEEGSGTQYGVSHRSGPDEDGIWSGERSWNR